MGIIPGEVTYEPRSPGPLEAVEGGVDNDGYSVTASMGHASDTSEDEEGEGHVRRFTSIILDNLQSNIDSWQAKLDAVMAEAQPTKGTDTPTVTVEDIDVEDGDMEDNDHDPDA